MHGWGSAAFMGDALGLLHELLHTAVILKRCGITKGSQWRLSEDLAGLGPGFFFFLNPHAFLATAVQAWVQGLGFPQRCG